MNAQRCHQALGFLSHDEGYERCGEPATVYHEDEDAWYCATCWASRVRAYAYWGVKP